MLNELNPMQTPPEVSFWSEIAKQSPAEKLKYKRELFDKMAEIERTEFLDFDLRLEGLTFGMPLNDFENQIIQSALAVNAYHTERLAARSVVIAQQLQAEKSKLDAGDFDEAVNSVLANLHTQSDLFTFYAAHALEKIKIEFANKSDWRGVLNKLEKYNQNFQNNLEKIAIILNALELINANG